jgi:hypothetical protein
LSDHRIEGTRAAWIAIVLVLVSVPHAIEDFAFGEPARVGVAPGIALCALLVSISVQLTGAWLALRENPWGGRFIAATGFVWFLGALLVHGPEISADGLHWRFGPTSVGELLLVVIASALAMWYGAIAAQSGSEKVDRRATSFHPTFGTSFQAGHWGLVRIDAVASKHGGCTGREAGTHERNHHRNGDDTDRRDRPFGNSGRAGVPACGGFPAWPLPKEIEQGNGALELRRLQMITEVGAEHNSTTIIMIPSEITSMARAIADKVSA